jgi:hypothetical protein
LQIIAIHPNLESATRPTRKGWVITIASPAYIVMKAGDEFKDKTTAPNELWQTDFSVPQQAA